MDLIMTITGRSRKMIEIISKAEYLLGIESERYKFEWDDMKKKIDFVDFPFNTTEDINRHIKVVKEIKPKISVAPDIEKGRELDEVLEIAKELNDHSDTVIIVPKSVHPSKIPSRFRVGLSLAEYGSDSDFSLEEFRAVNDLHLLGGGTSKQTKVFNSITGVNSMDGFSLGIGTQFGRIWDNGRWIYTGDHIDYYERLYKSLCNFQKYINRYDQKKL